MCSMLGFNISSIVPVGFMKTIKFCSFPTRKIKSSSISLWNNFVNIGLIFFLMQDETFCLFGISKHY
jgi:hypothetical protein